jgi:type I restriction enzyme S subunit
MSGWRDCMLGDIAALHYGKTLRTDCRKSGDVPVYSSAGLTGTHDEPLVNNKGLIVGRKGTVGKVYLSPQPFWCIDTAYYILPDDSKYDFKYLYFLLQTLGLEELNEDSAVPGLNRDTAYQQRLLLPPLPEQKAIAAVLSSLDDKIDLLHRQNQTLEAMAATLFRQWFVEEAQEDWEDVELGTVVETTSGGTPSRSKMEFYENGTINWVKSKELLGSFVLDTEEKITVDALKNSSAKLLPANSILIAMYGATVGEYAIIPKKMCCNQAVCALKPSQRYPYTFLFSYVKTYKSELINMAVGSAQQNISQLLIKQLPIPTCHEKISNFHLATEPWFIKIKNNICQIHTLEKLRDTLLPKLMSGQVRVIQNV